MPYCEAVVLEGVRLFMASTFGIPHRALRDTKLRGYNIPKVIGFFFLCYIYFENDQNEYF